MKHPFITLSLVAILSISSVMAQEPQELPAIKNPQLWQKVKSFAQRNKGKIIATGLAVVAAGLGTVAVAYINDEVNEAIKLAGIRPGTQEYRDAKLLLSTYGLLGKERGIEQLTQRTSVEYRVALFSNKVGKALAIYWGMDEATLIARLGAKGVGAVVREGVNAVKKGVNNIKDKFDKLF
jgi:hypothetical protein